MHAHVNLKIHVGKTESALLLLLKHGEIQCTVEIALSESIIKIYIPM
jgi:hypothetical protein